MLVREQVRQLKPNTIAMKTGKQYTALIPVLLFVLSLFASSSQAGEVRELPSFMLLADEFVARDAQAANEIGYAYQPGPVEAEFRKLGQEFPKNLKDQAFSNVSAALPSRAVIVGLKNDPGAPAAQNIPEGKKSSRLLFIGCPPPQDIKSFAIKTSEGTQHQAQTRKLK